MHVKSTFNWLIIYFVLSSVPCSCEAGWGASGHSWSERSHRVVWWQVSIQGLSAEIFGISTLSIKGRHILLKYCFWLSSKQKLHRLQDGWLFRMLYVWRTVCVSALGWRSSKPHCWRCSALLMLSQLAWSLWRKASTRAAHHHLKKLRSVPPSAACRMTTRLWLPTTSSSLYKCVFWRIREIKKFKCRSISEDFQYVCNVYFLLYMQTNTCMYFLRFFYCNFFHMLVTCIQMHVLQKQFSLILAKTFLIVSFSLCNIRLFVSILRLLQKFAFSYGFIFFLRTARTSVCRLLLFFFIFHL